VLRVPHPREQVVRAPLGSTLAALIIQALNSKLYTSGMLVKPVSESYKTILGGKKS
jgi:hypothetical protein